MRRFVNWLASPAFVFWLMPPLILLVAVGTVMQKFTGLYLAEQLVFSSFIIWLFDLVPLPGGYTLIGLLGVSLLAKFILKSRWTWGRAGINLAHFGVLVLLIGGLASSLMGDEGFINFAEGDQATQVRDYHQRELIVVKDGNIIASINTAGLHPGLVLKDAAFPFTLTVREVCRNCSITRRAEAGDELRSMARGMQLAPTDLLKNDEANTGGLTFDISGLSAEDNGTYILFEDGPTTKLAGYELAYTKQTRPLPFAITLQDFVKTTYPGTDTAKDYHSDVIIKDGSLSWPARIAMNAPLRYRGYTFYQSSFMQTQDGKEISVLAVTQNHGQFLPYIGTGIMAIGLLLHLLMRQRAALVLLLMLLPLQAMADDGKLDLSDFAQLPIAGSGRIQPLETFARNQLMALKGSDDGALSWLAATIFDPASAPDQRCFKVDNKHVQAMLGLELRADKTYTLAELAPGLGKTAETAEELAKRDTNSLSADETALLTLHTHVLAYSQMIQSLSLLLPMPVAVPQELRGHASGNSYLDAVRVEPEALEKVRHFIDHATPANLTEKQQELAAFVMAMQKLREGGNSNQMLRVIPTSWSADWMSPWAVLLSGQSSPQTGALLKSWQQLADAYRNGDEDDFSDISAHLLTQTLAQQPEANLENRLGAELLYYQLHPYLVAAAFMLAAIVLCRRKAGWWALLAGSVVLTAAIATRIYILQRPPVGTLYESALFVALIMAVVTLIATRRSLAAPFIAAGGATAAALITAAPLLASNGETLGVLSAVLNTNLWLTVHVLCITSGYGACLATALLAHALLVKDNEKLQPLMHRLSLAALLLTATGTLLGGVWADQSWGRFWGWDPKENGALIIVLWLLWLLHGRMGNLLSKTAFTAGMAALAVVVAQAWFGVNLLSVGLHSYGFITGIATALFAFTAIDLSVIAGLWLRQRRLHAPA